MAECVFCAIVDGTRHAYRIYDDDMHMAFLDLYPVVLGHTLVVPKQHYQTILEMPSESVGRLFSLVSVIAPAVLDATGAEAFNVGQNNGSDANQVVPHVHVHIIPRHANTKINWSSRFVPKQKELDKMAQNMRDRLRQHGTRFE